MKDNVEHRRNRGEFVLTHVNFSSCSLTEKESMMKIYFGICHRNDVILTYCKKRKETLDNELIR